MEFGIFHEFPWREGQDEAQAFTDAFELVDAAEQWGVDVLWLAELHFVTRSVLAAPMTIATAIAARTERMKIGMAVQILPLCNPLRLAEETATMDQISRGRLIFGVGRSGFQRTYLAYGIPYSESRDRFAETLDIVLKAWTEPVFSYDGKYYNYHDVRMVPKPFQKPHPEVRIAATSAETYPVLGRQGYRLFAGVRLGTFSDLLPDLQSYRTEWHAAGHPGDGQVFLRVPVYLAETASEAVSEPEQSIMAVYKRLADQAAAEAAMAPNSEAAAQRAQAREHLRSVTYEQALKEKVIVGTPEAVVDRLQGIQEELGVDGILAELNPGGLIPHDRVRRSMRLLAEKVMPSLN